ncbi:MAG: hypothetical protein R6W92_05360, partial [Desulfocurvibacter africanus]
MSWKDVAEVVAKYAPTVGGAIGGPIGTLAGAAASLLAKALGVEAEPEAVMAALKDPAVLVRLREIEAAERLGQQAGGRARKSPDWAADG